MAQYCGVQRGVARRLRNATTAVEPNRDRAKHQLPQRVRGTTPRCGRRRRRNWRRSAALPAELARHGRLGLHDVLRPTARPGGAALCAAGRAEREPARPSAGAAAAARARHVDDVAKAVCACILDTIPSDQIEAFKAGTLEEDRIRGTNVQKEALGGYSVTYVDGYDQIKACAQKATPAVLASAVAASKTTGAADADDGESVKMDAATTLGQLWLRVPVDMRGLSIPISNVPLKSALSTTDPTIPWRSFTAKEFESFKVEGLRGDSIIDAGESEGRSRLDTRWYKVAMTPIEQSPSASGSPNEGFLFGYKPYLYPLPPGIALFGSFGAVCLTSYLNSAV